MDWAKQPITGAKGVFPHQKGRFAPAMGQNAHSVVKIKPIYCYSSTLNRFVFFVIFIENDMSFTPNA